MLRRVRNCRFIIIIIIIKCDLIMCYNILNNLVDIESDAYFKRSKVHHTSGNK